MQGVSFLMCLTSAIGVCIIIYIINTNFLFICRDIERELTFGGGARTVSLCTRVEIIIIHSRRAPNSERLATICDPTISADYVIIIYAVDDLREVFALCTGTALYSRK